jgi:phosphoglycerate dehydrogenase-like enzyme
MKIAFAGSFAVRLADPVRARLSIPCEMVVDDEARILSRLAEADVIVSMGFTKEMAEASHRLRLIQVPGAGLDRIDRSALRPGMRLANAYGHEAGIAEYVIGAMIALTRSFRRIDSKLRQGQWDSQWAIGTPAPPLWPELAGKTLGILGFGHIGKALARRARCSIATPTRAAGPVEVAQCHGLTRPASALYRRGYAPPARLHRAMPAH